MVVYFVYLTATCFFVSANYVGNVYPDNGWKPTSIEKVLELQRDFSTMPNLHFVKTLQNSPKLPTVIDDFGDKRLLKIIQSNEINKTPADDNYGDNFQLQAVTENLATGGNEYHDFMKIIQRPNKEFITVQDTLPNWKINNHSKSNQQRKAKKLENTSIVLNLNNEIKEPIKIDTKIKDESNNAVVSSETYKVNENVEEDNQSASDKKLFYKEDLNNETPKSNTFNTKNNLTANLLDILASYNIRTSDNLRNYEISLRQNSRNSQNHDFVFMHVPMKLPIRYNNANHLPINPLLAVLLSNYGHYVPSLYGLHGGYNNLYGYLASNNIHNRPFGSYKIFSDSDSFY